MRRDECTCLADDLPREGPLLYSELKSVQSTLLHSLQSSGADHAYALHERKL